MSIDGTEGNDTIQGTADGDVINGGGGNDGISGGGGNDTINGGSGNDAISGDDGDDTINGDAGDDLISGGAGADVLNGGAGIDTLSYRPFFSQTGSLLGQTSPAGVTVNLSTGEASGGHADGDQISGFENISGTFFNDTLTGDNGANYLEGSAGGDRLFGLGGNDYLRAHSIIDGEGTGIGSSELYGGEGNDTLEVTLVSASAAGAYLAGGTGDDTYRLVVGFQEFGFSTLFENSGEGTDTVELSSQIQGGGFVAPPARTFTLADNIENLILQQSDFVPTQWTIVGNALANEIRGGNYGDILRGEGGNDLLSGLAGDDVLEGGDGNDNLFGGTGSDVLFGGAGNDNVRGEDGVDILIGGTGDDTIVGGSNVDTLILSGNFADYAMFRYPTEIFGSVGAFSITGPDGSDFVQDVEFVQFDDRTIRLLRGDGVAVNFETADPTVYQNALNAIRDFDGNALGGDGAWLRIGSADVNGDGDVDQILVNNAIGRFATVGTAPDGLTYFDDHSWAGETRVAGIYVDPLVQSGDVVAGSGNDSQRRFQNDLLIQNINRVLGADDYDGDGLQEVYFALTDGTAYLHAYMHADGNIQYANYQSQQQVIDFLTANGFGPQTYADWFPANNAPQVKQTDPVMEHPTGLFESSKDDGVAAWSDGEFDLSPIRLAESHFVETFA